MQYGVEVNPYQRMSKASNDIKKSIDINLVKRVIIYFVVSLLISRVVLVNSMAPFGLAFLITALMHWENKISLSSACGTLLGYITLQKNFESLGAYLILVAIITLLSYILARVSSVKKLIYIFIAILIEFIAFKYFIIRLSFPIALLVSFFETLCIFPIYYILNYSITCFKEYNTKHLFVNEEIVSMAITISIIIAGTSGIGLYGITLKNLLALSLILILSYVKGSAVGAASGVAIGAIVGMSSNQMVIYISLYSLCGLITGIFKESGKLITVLIYLTAFATVKMYSNIGSQFKVIEAIVSTIIFLSISRGFYDRLAIELDFEKKHEQMNENYGERVKGIILERLDNFSVVLSSMSGTLQSLVDNDNLEMKNKSSSLVQNLADRVCENCSMNAICWRKEQYNTYNAFAELIQNYQEKKTTIPKEIQRKCINRTVLQKCTEDIVNNFIINEMWRIRLSEGRELLAEQIYNMAGTVEEIVEEFSTSIKFNNEVENNIRRIFDREKIEFNDILCFNDKNERLIIKLSREACAGSNMCVKEILPLLNSVLGKSMCIGDDGCKVEKKDNTCDMTFVETPKYHVATATFTQCKDGEGENGDSYACYKLNDGNYMAMISDGMGSGPQANKESDASVKIIEKFTKAGFSKNAAINAVNSIMSLKFSADEKFSTLDLNSIDLYTGQADFIKVGAAQSFIKRGSNVQTIRCKSLPIGVLDKVDMEVISEKVKNSDVIVMLSDGVLDCISEDVVGTNWIEELLGNLQNQNPKEIAADILKEAMKLSGGKIKDDMTVMVSKVYSLY